MSHISIIMPVLNEAQNILPTLQGLQPLRRAGHELVVVDGGSRDNTVELARPLADQVIGAPRGRARQMNAGALQARGEVLLFLHADTQLPARAPELILHGLRETGKCWGRFDARLSGGHFLLRLVERLMNWRSRVTGIATGDQAMFVLGSRFAALGGFPDIALMEDITLSRRLKRHSAPLCLRQKVITSGRRWEQNGIMRTILFMWWLRLAYFFGADPEHLARRYSRSR